MLTVHECAIIEAPLDGIGSNPEGSICMKCSNTPPAWEVTPLE